MLLLSISSTNKFARRIFNHIYYVFAMLVGVPLFYVFEMYFVLPKVIEQYSIAYYVHISMATFILTNVIANMLYAMLINPSIQGKLLCPSKSKDWAMCLECEGFRPPRAWHCSICNICILKRDHHCKILATCVGYYNYRYFIMFSFYLCVAMVYGFYYNVWFLARTITWNDKWILLKFAFPLVCFGADFNPESIYILVVVLNLLSGILSWTIFCFHVENVICGCTSPEKKLVDLKNKEAFIYNRGLKCNLVECLGSRWYLTWICPFIKSPLPGNGIEWSKTNKKVQ